MYLLSKLETVKRSKKNKKKKRTTTEKRLLLRATTTTAAAAAAVAVAVVGALPFFSRLSAPAELINFRGCVCVCV